MADSAHFDNNHVPSLMGVSDVDGISPVTIYADPVTHRLLVDIGGGGGTGTWYDVTGTINGSNVTFTIPVTPTSDILLFLARQPQMDPEDFSLSGDTITYTTAPDASLSGQPHKAFVIS